MRDGEISAVLGNLADDGTRIPYAAYTDSVVFAREQEWIFEGPTWNYLGLEAEIPNPGDFRLTYVGCRQVILNRTLEGNVRAFVNQCAHRGAPVRREEFGNANAHICCYHHWCYNLEGTLTGVPFARGVSGKGGLPQGFSMGEHRLQALHVATLSGAVFGTFTEHNESLEEYLGSAFVTHLQTMLSRPIRILGYHQQFVRGNWKLYTDNVRDPNHGGLLHPFTVNMATYRLTMSGGAVLDARGRHNATFTMRNADAPDAAKKYTEQAGSTLNDKVQVRDPRLFVRHVEHSDGISTAIVSIFPGVVFQRIGNSYAVRHIRPKSVDSFELAWTYFGYADDTPEMLEHRLLQANLSGASGLISLEDGEAIEFVHNTIAAGAQGCSMPIIGGLGPIETQTTMVTEVPLRGFWRYWKELMSQAQECPVG